MSLASERRAAVERMFPGVICKRVEFKFHQYTRDNSWYRYFPNGRKFVLSCCVEAPAEIMIAHGLVSREEIQSLPPSGKRSGLRRTDRGTYQASIFWYDDPDCPSRGRDMAAKIGIAHIEDPLSQERQIRGRSLRWNTRGDVIHVDWADLQRQVAAQRAIVAPMASERTPS